MVSRGEELKKEMFLVPKRIGIGNPPMRIDLLKTVDIIDFSYAFNRSAKRIIDGLPVHVIGLDDLILLKKAAVQGRNKSKDIEDLKYLQQKKSNRSLGEE